MMKKWKGRLLGAIAAGALAVSMAPAIALAEGALVLDSTPADADPEGPGYSLTVSGLENGDTAKYYKIIEQDGSTQQWRLTAAVDRDADGIVDGTEATDFGHKDLEGQTVLGLHVEEMVIVDFEEENDEVTSDTRQLTPAMVNALATAVTNNQAANVGGELTAYEGKVTVANATSGLYMFVAVPVTGDTNYIYKPIFVSADYYNIISTPEDNTHQLEVVANKTDYYNDEGVFKRSPLAIDKKSGKYDENGNPTDMQNDVAVGDTVEFSISFPIPTYSKNYVAPQFYVTDTLTEGLHLLKDTIKVEVKNDDSTVATAEDEDYRIYTNHDDDTATATYKTFKGMANGPEGFVVQFLNDKPGNDVKQDGFLYTVLGAPTATVTYQAKVTTEEGATFAQQVNQMDNTAKLEYSKDPNFVPAGYFTTESKEVVKLDEDGNPIPKLDDDGNPVIDPVTGEVVYETETKDVPTPDPSTDTNKPDLVDGDGNPDPVGELQDKTRHYTFDIDADVLGPKQGVDEDGNPIEGDDETNHDKTSEIRKIFVDANGKVIQEKTTSDVIKGGDEEEGKKEDPGKYGWLEGAVFTLTKTKAHVTIGEGKEKFEPLTTEEPIKFDAATHIRVTEGGADPTSDAKGYIAMKGLDAGVYILKEKSAPLGYAFNPNMQYEITITPDYVLEDVTPAEGTTPEDGKGGADDLILKSYEVKIVCQQLDDNMNIVSGQEVETISTYNMNTENGKPVSLLTEDGEINPAAAFDLSTQTFGSNETAMIMNKKLGMLPATGGSGIFFYLGIGGLIALVSYVLMRKLKKASKPAA